MSAITTHVLDTSAGRPASGVPVTLETRGEGGDWRLLGRGATDADGRLRDLLPDDFDLKAGAYRLTFDAGDYFARAGVEGFYAEVVVAFVVRDAGAHYHVPLLLSPFGYTTYRGS
ncbi:MAG TPA: hydroxyisourate hydrolase [Pyrinomonadaceae bacterium]|nr:hydroxyisourate hydrolase [Pyrinomonadaceae bacterium]